MQEFDFLRDMESYPNTLRRPQHRLELSDAVMPLQESPPIYAEPELIQLPDPLRHSSSQHKHSSATRHSAAASLSSEQLSLSTVCNPFQFQPIASSTNVGLTKETSSVVLPAGGTSAVDQQLHRPVLTLPPVVLLGGRRAEEDESVPASPLVEYPEDDDEYLYSGGGGLQPSHSNSSSVGDRFCVEVRRFLFFYLIPFYFSVIGSGLVMVKFCYCFCLCLCSVLFCFENTNPKSVFVLSITSAVNVYVGSL